MKTLCIIPHSMTFPANSDAKEAFNALKVFRARMVEAGYDPADFNFVIQAEPVNVEIAIQKYGRTPTMTTTVERFSLHSKLITNEVPLDEACPLVGLVEGGNAPGSQ